MYVSGNRCCCVYLSLSELAPPSNGGSLEKESEKSTGTAEEDVEDEKFDAPAGQLELANAIKIYSVADEQIIIKRIRKLASRILKQWSDLPVCFYFSF